MARLRQSPMTNMRSTSTSLSDSTSSDEKSAPELVTRDNAVHLLSSGTRSMDVLSRELLPGGTRALDGISLRAFCLGLVLGMSSIITVLLLGLGNPLWRAIFFMAALALFHFLEYYITAAHNTRFANVEAFLLTGNGRAYNAAHTTAFMETVLTSFLAPHWQMRLSNKWTICLGLAAMVIGQAVRSGAMAEAGTNFNHTVQTRRNSGHELVTTGLYARLRHPSYFGFFWWGLGTQLVLGNAVCFTIYTLVLWTFFSKRISSKYCYHCISHSSSRPDDTTEEEEFLVRFFGKEYVDYRSRTRVGIPFIR